MKNIALCFMALMLTVMAYSQTVIDNPKHGLSSQPGVVITKIEFNDNNTILWFRTSVTPGSTISIPKNSYIAVSGSDEKLYISSTEGIPLGESVAVPASGVLEYKIVFPKIDHAISSMDYGEEGGSWFIYDIRLKELQYPVKVPQELSGHWFNIDNGMWEVSFLDTVVVYQKKVWEYDRINFKNQKGTINIKNGASRASLPVKLEKEILVLEVSPQTTVRLSRDATGIRTGVKTGEEIFKAPVFKNDTVVFSCYLKGYSPRVKASTGTVYVNNILTGNQDNYLFKISGNGYFSVKMPFFYPHEAFIRSDVYTGTVYLEPGKDLFQMLDPDYPTLVLFMGENSLLNSDMQELNKINSMNYVEMMDTILNMTPAMYKAYCLDLMKKENNMLDSMIRIREFTPKAIQLKRSATEYKWTYQILEYKMDFEGAYRTKNKIPSSQRTLPVTIETPGVDYYDFLSNDLANNPLGILTNDYYYFINRLKYSEILSGVSTGFTTMELAEELEKAGCDFTEEERAMFADLKQNFDQQENNVLNEFFRKYKDKLNEFTKKYSQEISELTSTNSGVYPKPLMILKYLSDKGFELSEEEKEMLEARGRIVDSEANKKNTEIMKKYTTQLSKFSADYSKQISLVMNRKSSDIKKENLKKKLGISSGFVTDIMYAQDVCRSIVKEVTPMAGNQLQLVQKQFTDPFISLYIVKCNNETLSKIAANKKLQATGGKGGQVSVYNETPKTEGDVLFETIMKKYRGKVVHVDFWATWCGPCISGIERIKPLKAEMAGKDVVFVYLTNQTSPKETYENMIPDIKGEHYRLSSDEWNILSGKFNVTGIPHIVLVDKNGVVVNPHLMYMENRVLKAELDKLLNK
jgi:thiol-disulfide isomerase/thioredoxin